MQIGSEVKSEYRPDPKINKILDPNPDRTGSGTGSGKTRIFLGPGPEKKIKLWTRTRKKDKILDSDPTGFGSGPGLEGPAAPYTSDQINKVGRVVVIVILIYVGVAFEYFECQDLIVSKTMF